MLPLAIGIWLALAPQDAGEKGPSAEQVAQATGELDSALRSRDLKQLKTALEAAQAVAHPEVVRRVARALDDERSEVKLAAVQALRWLDHAEALEALHRAARDRKLMKLPDLPGAVMRAIGQHADPRSISVLAHDPFQPQDGYCIRARILGLGHIRSRESVEALLGILAESGSEVGTRRVKPWMEDMRLALVVLTGVDQGLSPELWERWWRENRKGFQVPAELPELPREMRETWADFWGLSRDYGRDRRREDRGNEPPRGK